MFLEILLVFLLPCVYVMRFICSVENVYLRMCFISSFLSMNLILQLFNLTKAKNSF